MSSPHPPTPDRATATEPRRIGWVGTGIMGASMAGHLLRAGHAVTVHSRTRAKARHLLDAGAQWAETPAEAARGADFVCTNVGLPSEVEAVHFGHDGVLSTVSEGQCLIDFSTSPPSLARRISEAAASKGAAALDAPVSGGDVGARNATLSIMVGGDPAAFERAMPLFSAVGKAVVLQGSAGSGQRTKIVNQVLVAASTLGMCEAMHYAQVAGLDPQRVLDAVSGGAAASWALSNLAPRILRGDFEPGFMVEHLVKDLRIARDEAQELGEVLPLVDLCLSRYEHLAASGHPRKGTQGLYLLYRDRLGKA
ncbi:MAG: NAD(P)-dependent oxidoreductase [Planctomycetaceae bacterium]|nr:NAD(P)-dependent oxidoreductase [Planctomycetaceae bacterium]